MQFVDGNPNDRGFQLKERDCLLQSGASSHCDPWASLTLWSKMVEELFGMSQKVGFTDHIYQM